MESTLPFYWPPEPSSSGPASQFIGGLDAATAGILGLNEALSATMLSWALFGENFSLLSALSGTLVLTAIAIELLRNRSHVQEGSMRLGNKLE
ncbi:MAG TPA: hypothetical protein VGJ13_05910 [Pseudonocardiaceae bacterium]|jgi:hypothetical protein